MNKGGQTFVPSLGPLQQLIRDYHQLDRGLASAFFWAPPQRIAPAPPERGWMNRQVETRLDGD